MSLPAAGEIRTSTGNLSVRRVGPEMADTALKLLREAAGWMQSNGVRQWRPEQFTDQDVLGYFEQREVYMAFKGEAPAGMFTLQFGDSLHWGFRNDDGYAYLHRLAVSLPFRGEGIGGQLLRYAAGNVRLAGYKGLRLDTIEHNVKLNRFYHTQGFRYMGTNDAGGKLVNLYEHMGETADQYAIRLQYFDDSDFEALKSWNGSPEFLKQWAGPSLHYPLMNEELKEYIREANRPADSQVLAYSAVHLAAGRAIGHISLAGIDRDNGNARLARVILDPMYRGRGFGRRMLGEAMRIGFEGLRLHRLSLGVFDFNAPAISAYEALGFRREGEQVETARFGDRYVNLIEMAMLDREWEERRADILGS